MKTLKSLLVLVFCLFGVITSYAQYPTDIRLTTSRDTIGCIGDTVKIVANLTGPYVNPVGYRWYINENPDIVDDTLKITIKNYPQSIYKKYTFSYSGNTVVKYSDTITIQSAPMITSTIYGDTMVCIGQPINYTLTNAYSWTSSVAELTGNENSITATFTQPGYIEVISDTNSCGISDTTKLYVSIYPELGGISTLVGDSIVYSGSVNTYSVDPVENAVYYEWIFNDEVLSGYYSNTADIPFFTTGYLKVRAIGQCYDVISIPFHVVVSQLSPSVTINSSVSGGQTILNSGYSAPYISEWHAFGETGKSTFDTIAGYGQYYTVMANGQYYVIVKDTANGISTTSDSVNIFMSGIASNGITNGVVSIYPNPAKSQLSISVAPKLIGSEFSITDAVGRKVLSGKLTTENSLIDIDQLSNGIYLLHIGESAQQSFKVVKE